MASVRCVRCGGRITADGVHLAHRKARECAGKLVRQLGMPSWDCDGGGEWQFPCPRCGSRRGLDCEYDVLGDYYICGCGCKFRISETVR
jgi:DNA-directed RNA polymerase subunit RPC12/RpoP